MAINDSVLQFPVPVVSDAMAFPSSGVTLLPLFEWGAIDEERISFSLICRKLAKVCSRATQLQRAPCHIS